MIRLGRLDHLEKQIVRLENSVTIIWTSLRQALVADREDFLCVFLAEELIVGEDGTRNDRGVA